MPTGLLLPLSDSCLASLSHSLLVHQESENESGRLLRLEAGRLLQQHTRLSAFSFYNHTMSNSYGFDFLRTEHKLDADGNPIQVSSSHNEQALLEAPHSFHATPDAANKPDLEKQYDILAFLQAHRGSGCLAPSVIYRATGIDLDIDIRVAEMLKSNAKIRVEMVPDPENPALMVATYAYQAKYSNVRDRTSLLAQINRMTSGVPMRDLLDSYQGVERDIDGLITGGDIIAVYNSEDRDKILFPRGDDFLVELDGFVTLPAAKHGSTANGYMMNGGTGGHAQNGSGMMRQQHYTVETDVDPTNQIRRGEAVQVGGQWFRVSSAVKDGPLSEQPARAQAPLSVVSYEDLSKRNEVDGYIRPFTAKLIPLDHTITEAAQRNIMAARMARDRLVKLTHGRSGGVSSQLLGSHAHASNPKTLAASFAQSATTNVRKRPNAKTSASANNANASASSTAAHQEALAKAAADPALSLYRHARRHGCTKDVRQMYLDTKSLVPESDADLQKVLIENKLLEPGEKFRRDRLQTKSNVDNDGKPKKRRYYERKNQRMTNTHLEGTEIGAVLALAAEKQKQGKSVGDGGM